MATAEQTVSAVLQNLGTDNIVEVDDKLDTDGYRIETYASGLMKIYSLVKNQSGNTNTLTVTFPRAFAHTPLVFLQRSVDLTDYAAYRYFCPREVNETSFVRANDENSTYAYLAIGRCA